MKVNMDQNLTVWRKQKNIIQIGEFIMMCSWREDLSPFFKKKSDIFKYISTCPTRSLHF